MKKLINISLDAMGGDSAPEIVVDGAAQAKVRYPNLKFTFSGDKNIIYSLIDSFSNLQDSNIVHTEEFISAAISAFSDYDIVILMTNKDSQRILKPIIDHFEK